MSDESPNTQGAPSASEDSGVDPAPSSEAEATLESEATPRRLTMFVQPRTNMESATGRRSVLYVGTNAREAANL